MNYRTMSAVEIMDVPLGSWWLQMMRLSGIPPKHSAAHLQRNCRIFQGMKGKKDAYNIALRYAMARKVVKESRIKHSLLIGGSVGTGKTWLATAVFKHILWNVQAVNSKQKMFIWITFNELMRSIQGTYSDKTKSTEEAIIPFKNASCLLIDDFGDMDEGESSNDKRSIVYEIIDARNSNERNTILTTNLELPEMKNKWGSRVFERVAEMSMYIPMKGDNMRQERPNATDDERMITESMKAMEESRIQFDKIPDNWYENPPRYEVEVF